MPPKRLPTFNVGSFCFCLLVLFSSIPDNLLSRDSGEVPSCIAVVNAAITLEDLGLGDDDLDLDLDRELDLDTNGADALDEDSSTGTGFDYQFDDEDDDLEEYSFESPDAVHKAWKSALEEFKEQASEDHEEMRKVLRDLQRKVSNGEMTKDELKEKRVEMEKELEEKTGIPIACQQGRQSCLHDENSPLKERAVAEAKAHMSHRQSNQRAALRSALMPSLAMPDVEIGSLPRPPPGVGGDGAGDGSGGEGGDGNEEVDVEVLVAAAEKDPEAFALLSPGMQSYVASVAVVKDVQNGAIVNTGALPFNITEWEDLAEKSREKKDKRTYGRDEIDVAWRIATEMQEKHAKANRSKNSANASNEVTGVFPTQVCRR